ncbi:MAG: Gfo/Idh/MocA family oxidoreductase [Spirochaetales bacterium]
MSSGVDKSSGMMYAPKGKPKPVCGKGEFAVGVVGLEHGHIYGMCNGLVEAGAEVVLVYDPDPAKVAAFRKAFPEAQAARSMEEVLEHPRINLIASAAIPADRAGIGMQALAHGKDYFADKPPFTTLAQIDEARKKTVETGKRYAVYYSERLHVESAVFAGNLIAEGAIGRVVQVLGTGPHRISLSQRPEWFFQKEKYGGILVDIGSHQIEQFLFFTGAKDAKVLSSRVANFKFKQYPGLEDFGDATLLADNGATGYFRVDWFTPDGLNSWGDGRTFILGTEGYIELRKYLDVGRSPEGDQVFLVDHKGEHHYSVAGQVGFPFFGELIRDILDGTRKAFDQELFFRATELAIIAELQALKIE